MSTAGNNGGVRVSVVVVSCSARGSHSTRGKSGSPFLTLSPTGRRPNVDAEASVSTSPCAWASSPNCSQIRCGVRGIKGRSKMEITRSDSAILYNTVERRSKRFSRANCQGAVSSMYLLPRFASSKISASAPPNCRLSMCALTAPGSARACAMSAASSSSAKMFAGVLLCENFSIIATARLNRLPRSLAKSELSRCTSSSSVKLPSLPKDISFSK